MTLSAEVIGVAASGVGTSMRDVAVTLLQHLPMRYAPCGTVTHDLPSAEVGPDVTITGYVEARTVRYPAAGLGDTACSVDFPEQSASFLLGWGVHTLSAQMEEKESLFSLKV